MTRPLELVRLLSESDYFHSRSLCSMLEVFKRSPATADQLKALSNEIAPNPSIFFARKNFPPIFRKGSVVFWARIEIKNKHLNKDLKMIIVKYLCHPGLDSF
jgi:hypothetical protein